MSAKIADPDGNCGKGSQREEAGDWERKIRNSANGKS